MNWLADMLLSNIWQYIPSAWQNMVKAESEIPDTPLFTPEDYWKDWLQRQEIEALRTFAETGRPDWLSPFAQSLIEKRIGRDIDWSKYRTGPSREDQLIEQMANLYAKQGPEALRDIIRRGEGSAGLINLFTKSGIKELFPRVVPEKPKAPEKPTATARNLAAEYQRFKKWFLETKGGPFKEETIRRAFREREFREKLKEEKPFIGGKELLNKITSQRLENQPKLADKFLKTYESYAPDQVDSVRVTIGMPTRTQEQLIMVELSKIPTDSARRAYLKKLGASDKVVEYLLSKFREGILK